MAKFQADDGMDSGQIVSQMPKSRRNRCLVAYWILGLCNNYGYVVMLTAANDIISEYSNDTAEKNKERNCTYLSTGAILLADIIPSLVIKILAPFLPFLIHIRMSVCLILACAGFLLVALSSAMWMAVAGVVVTSLSAGLGEVTLLQYSSFYNKNVVSTWSSGTGGAGVVGALSYSILSKISMRKALLIMLIIPISMAISFWLLLPRPSEEDIANFLSIQNQVNEDELKNPKDAFKKKLRLIPGLMKYMIPLGLVYLFEYFINQGTFELVDFRNIDLPQEDQYKWLQVAYQVGVLISRSSVNCLYIKHVWILAVLQFLNVAVYTTEVIYFYLPSYYIVVVFTLWEGLLGGAAYVNTFYRISSEVEEEQKQFSMAITSFADSIGISLAGLLAMWAHNKICDLPLPDKVY